MKASEWHECRRSSVFIINYEHISQFTLLFYSYSNFEQENGSWEEI